MNDLKVITRRVRRELQHLSPEDREAALAGMLASEYSQIRCMSCRELAFRRFVGFVRRTFQEVPPGADCGAIADGIVGEA